MELIIDALVRVVIILITAKLAGELFEKFRQSAVLGELLVGVLLGPSLLGFIDPTNEILKFLAEVGVILLLFEVGLESNLVKMLKVGWNSFRVAIIGVLIPFILGWAYYHFMGHTLMVSLFVGATLTATSVGVTIRVLGDIKKVDSPEGRVILGAAVIDDIIGLIILSVLVSMIQVGSVQVSVIARSIVFAMLFLVLTTWIGIRYAETIFKYVHSMQVRGALISASVAFAFILAVLANLIGLATIVGSFAAGLVLETTERKEHIIRRIAPVSDLFVPMFFIMAGAHTDLHSLSLRALPIIGILFVIAIISKLVSGWGCQKKVASRLGVGIGMMPRGEVGLIFATIGLSGGIISAELYGILVIVIMATTLVTPPVLRPVLLAQGKKEV